MRKKTTTYWLDLMEDHSNCNCKVCAYVCYLVVLIWPCCNVRFKEQRVNEDSCCRFCRDIVEDNYSQTPF